MCIRVAPFQIFREIAAVPPQCVGIFVERFEQFQNLRELLLRELFTVRQVAQAHVLSAKLDENLVQLRVIIHVFDSFAPGDLIKRRLGDIDKALLDQLRHLAVKER